MILIFSHSSTVKIIICKQLLLHLQQISKIQENTENKTICSGQMGQKLALQPYGKGWREKEILKAVFSKPFFVLSEIVILSKEMLVII